MRTIDLHHLGRERVIAAYLVDGVIVDPGPSSCLPTLLEALGDETPRALLLTHIHLDHAGASGSLVRRWPELEVYVHERGAPHMVDPARLLESATRLYGADMDRLWGEFVAVPEERLRVLQGGEQILDGAFEVAYTPGHASHHVCYLHDGTAFVGDVGGVRIMPGSLTIPPTPPPDIDIEAWQQSLELVRGWRARAAGDDAFRDQRRRRRTARRARRAARRLGRARPCPRRGRIHRDGSRPRSRPTPDAETLPGVHPGRATRPAVRRASAGTGASAPNARVDRRYPEPRMPQTIELPRVGGPGAGAGGLWRVVVLNDDFNTFDHVAETLARVIPGVTLAQGYRLADRIHHSGCAIVWSGSQEDAEGYWPALDAAGLSMAPLETG